MSEEEKQAYSSSQESDILSQDTFQYLWNQVQGCGPQDNFTLDCSYFLNPSNDSNRIVENCVMDQDSQAVPELELQQNSAPRFSLPATQNWPGEYSFLVTFGQQEKSTKGVAWTYSELKNKLYVGKDTPCPINFSTSRRMGENVQIRAMALFSSPENAQDVVHRCVNHSMEEISKGVCHAEHLVRCESQMAAYEEDPFSRHSVVVPFDNPPAGQHFSTYIYKFACFGSCAGGPNRRPLMLIFSLERGQEVIGRRKLHVKICACPGRDRKTEEQDLPLKANANMSNLSETFAFTKNVAFPPPKKMKPNKDASYAITVRDPQCYEFLKQMKKFYDICKLMAKPKSFTNLKSEEQC